ncbi:MAG: type II secretion system protein [Verrucomicrobiaceae bacterium]|nr:type II secretion system protein [Verrucomicrobiaceae bacterium]
MKNVKLNIRKLGKQGFSLIEMLVVIAVIGVIAAIAIPNIGNINSSAQEATAQRNAQSLASTINSAVNAGWADNATDTLPATKAAVIDAISAGIEIEDGPFTGKRFVVPSVPTTGTNERTDLEAYLTWDNAQQIMEYNAAAVASNTAP